MTLKSLSTSSNQCNQSPSAKGKNTRVKCTVYSEENAPNRRPPVNLPVGYNQQRYNLFGFVATYCSRILMAFWVYDTVKHCKPTEKHCKSKGTCGSKGPFPQPGGLPHAAADPPGGSQRAPLQRRDERSRSGLVELGELAGWGEKWQRWAFLDFGEVAQKPR